MEKSMSRKKLVAAVVAAAIVVLGILAYIMVSGNKTQTYRSIKIVEMEGNVAIERDGKDNLNASVNMNLVSGDYVTTAQDSYVVLRLDSDKYVMLGESGAMKVNAEGDEQNGRTSIELASGSVLNEIQNPLSQNSTFDIVTPNATMSVRGTVFEVRKNSNGSYGVLVYDGHVAVGLDGMEPVMYDAGEYAEFTEGDAPKFLTEKGTITEEQMGEKVLERLQQIQEQGRSLNLDVIQKSSDASSAKAEEETVKQEEAAKEAAKIEAERKALEAQKEAEQKIAAQKAEEQKAAEAAKKELAQAQTQKPVQNTSKPKVQTPAQNEAVNQPAASEQTQEPAAEPDVDDDDDDDDSDASEPSQPNTPDTDQPVTPEQPDTPNTDQPVTPEQPDKPNPDQPVTPEQPDKPNPDQPVTPDQPDKPTPDKPETPGGDDKGDVSDGDIDDGDDDNSGSGTQEPGKYTVTYKLPYVVAAVQDGGAFYSDLKEIEPRGWGTKTGDEIAEIDDITIDQTVGYEEGRLEGGATSYKLIGWCTEDGQQWDFKNDVVEKDMVLYPIWSNGSKTYYPIIYTDPGTQKTYCNNYEKGTVPRVNGNAIPQ